MARRSRSSRLLRDVEGEATLRAFVVLLEMLTPLERAVYLLRAVFDHPLTEVASIVGLSEASCRTLLRRARGRIESYRS